MAKPFGNSELNTLAGCAHNIFCLSVTLSCIMVDFKDDRVIFDDFIQNSASLMNLAYSPLIVAQ